MIPKELELIDLIAKADEVWVLAKRLHDRIPDTPKNCDTKGAASVVMNEAAALAKRLRENGLDGLGDG